MMIFLSNMPIFQLVTFTLWLIMTNRQSRVTLVVSPGRSKPSWSQHQLLSHRLSMMGSSGSRREIAVVGLLAFSLLDLDPG